MKKPVAKKSLGPLGEKLAARHLLSKGFSIVARNYRKPYGEIDIIAQKGTVTHFCEVKAVTREIGKDRGERISRETEVVQPEENVHAGKLKRLSRVVQAYLSRFSDIEDWQFDVIAVLIDSGTKRAIIRVTADIPLGE